MITKKTLKQVADEICDLLKINQENITDKINDQQWDDLQSHGDGCFNMTFEEDVEYKGEKRAVDLDLEINFFLDKEGYLDMNIQEAYLIIFMNDDELAYYPDDEYFVQKVNYRL